MNDREQQEFVVGITEIQRDLYAFILTLLPNSSDADDVLQEANRVLWEKRGEFMPGTNFRAWAYTIARFQVLDHRKPRRRDALIFSNALIEQMASEATAEADETSAQRVALKECLKKVSRDDQHLIDLRYASGLLAPQIARQLNRPAASIRQSLFRIRQSLMRCVQARLRQEEAE